MQEDQRRGDRAVEQALQQVDERLAGVVLADFRLVVEVAVRRMSSKYRGDASEVFNRLTHFAVQNILEVNVSWCHLITENGIEALARGCNKIRKFSSKGRYRRRRVVAFDKLSFITITFLSVFKAVKKLMTPL